MSDCKHLQVFNQVAKDSILDIAVVTGDVPYILPVIKNSLLRKLFKAISLISCHIDIGNKIRKNKNKQAVIVHGFSNEFLLVTYFCSLFLTKNVYLLTHHNIQQAFQNPMFRVMLKLYAFLKYKFILNETLLVLKDIGFSEQQIANCISINHPVLKIKPFDTPNNCLSRQKKIGLIGQARKEKRIEKTLKLLIKLQKKLDFQLVVGTDDLSSFDELDMNEVKLINTSDRNDYYAALAACDIVVLNYACSKYLYRCSGVIADAIGTQTFVICPNFPLMSNQINYPTKVGLSYQNESDLEAVIQQAIEICSSSHLQFENHYIERSIEKAVFNFNKDLKIRMKANI